MNNFNLIFENLNFSPDESVAIAVSGGVDSMSLAYIASKYFNKKPHAIIINHNLRAESSKEAEDVKNELNKLGLECKIIAWEGKKPNNKVQELAREKRYELMINYCHSNKISKLLTAHHLDDQIETFIMRSKRNSGNHGLACMPAIRRYKNIDLIRPLLSIDKKTIIDFAISNNLKWFEDSTNASAKYERNRVRQEILLMPPAEKESIVNKIYEYGRKREENGISMQSEVADLCHTHNSGFVLLKDKPSLMLFGYLLRYVSGNEHPARTREISECYEAAFLQNKAACLSGVMINRSKNNPYKYFMAKEEKVRFKNHRISSNLKNDFHIKSLGRNNWGKIKQYSQKPDWAVDIQLIYTLPAIYELETLASVNHIGYINKEYEGKDMRIHFEPNFPLDNLKFIAAKKL